jgi:hypothetical protein
MVDGAKHSMTEALKGQAPEDLEASGKPEESGQPQATHEQVAEDTRREQEARSHGRPDRDEYLVNVGRGQQTHG